jgi:hypothetical protein
MEARAKKGDDSYRLTDPDDETFLVRLLLECRDLFVIMANINLLSMPLSFCSI